MRAIAATFQRRGTPLPNGLPVALTSTFVGDALKNTQWSAFARKSGASGAGDLAGAAAAIVEFAKRHLAPPCPELRSRHIGLQAAHGDERIRNFNSIPSRRFALLSLRPQRIPLSLPQIEQMQAKQPHALIGRRLGNNRLHLPQIL